MYRGEYCMNKITNFLQRYLVLIAVLIGISILLSVTFSSFIVSSNNHKAAEMYIGELKYSIELNGSSTNTLTVPTGETIVNIKVNNLNPVDTYYKLLYLKNTNITVKYYESTKDTKDVVTTYNKPNDSITSSNFNNIKLLITNNSTSSQNVAFTMKGGYITNTIQDITTPSTYSEITLVDTSTNTYFCNTSDTLTDGYTYTNSGYTYKYKWQVNLNSSAGWGVLNYDGFGVQQTDRTSTSAFSGKMCTYINDKPILSMVYTFYNSNSTSLDLSNVNTSNVINMSNMFYGSQATTLDLSSFNTSKVTDMSGMFRESQATTLDVSNFDTSKVTNMGGMFWSSQATTLNLSSFDTSKVTDMSSMFLQSKVLTLNLSNFDTSKVTNMKNMFTYSKATSLNVSNFDTSNVINMGGMFNNTAATTLDVSNFDTSKVTNMNNMFEGSKATTLDLSNFDTSKVTDMSYMFYSSKASELDLSNFDTSNVTDMGYMFSYGPATILGLSNFNTSNVTNMTYMFSNNKATTLDLSSFNTSKVTNMSWMFASLTNLKTIYTSDKFNINAVNNSQYMFYNSTSLVGGAGTKYNLSYVDETYARIDGGTSSPGYFTDIADKDIPAPSSFSTDSWKTIIKAVKNNNVSKYSVGDTKEIDLGTTYGTHTLRIANKSTPSSCSTSGYSQTACGFVIEFADIITTYNMNPAGTYKNVEYKYGWNKDGWPASAMRTFVNNDIYNSLPSDLRNGIVETTVVSGYGSSDSANFTSTDKLYLLSPMEVWGDWTGMYGSEVDRSKNQTRQLDYYSNLGVTYKNYNSAIKKYGTSQYFWWHRSAKYDNNIGFYGMQGNGYAYRDGGVSPAFKVG